GGARITLNGGTLAVTGATTIDNEINVSSASTINNTANATLSGVISGSGALTKSGTATLSLTGTNTHTGAVSIAAGSLSVAGGNAIGNSSAVIMAPGTVLTLADGNETIGSLSGMGTAVLGANHHNVANSNNNTGAGVTSGTEGFTNTGTRKLTLERDK